MVVSTTLAKTAEAVVIKNRKKSIFIKIKQSLY